MDWLKCNICFCTYNDSNIRPRVLSCGHSFCERCLLNTIQNENLTCPQCRKKHIINSVADLPINFVLEGLLKSLNPYSKDPEKGAISHGEQYDPRDKNRETEANGDLNTNFNKDKENSLQKDVLKESAGMCIEHPNTELIFRCSSHKSWVCEKCIEKIGDHPKDLCNITSFKEEIEDRRKGHEHFLENQDRLCNETLLLVENHISDLSDKRTLHVNLVGSLQDLVNKHKNEDKRLQNEKKIFEKIIENGYNVKERLQDVKGSVQNAVTLNESNAARYLLENMSKETIKWIKNSEKEIEEGNEKLISSTQIAISTKRSLDFNDNSLLLNDSEININCSQSNQNFKQEINANHKCFIRKNKLRIPNALNEDHCDIHRETITHWCFECQMWICKDCLEIHSNQIGCSTIPFYEAMENMREKKLKSTNEVLKVFNKNAKYMEFMIQENIDQKKEFLERAEEHRKMLLEKAEKHDKEVRRLSNLLKLGNLHKEELLECIENVNLEKTPYTVCKQVNVLAHRKLLLQTWNFNSLEADVSIKLLMALKKHEFIYTMVNQYKEGWTKVSKYGEDIFIHTFQTQEVTEEEADEDMGEDKDQEKEEFIEMPDNENNEEEVEDKVNEESNDEEKINEDDCIEKRIMIDINCLQKMISKNISLVFLQFSMPYPLMEPVQIRLTTNLAHIKENILQIFTGQNSHSLKNLQFNVGLSHLRTGKIELFKENEIGPTLSETNQAKRGDVIADYEDGYLAQLYLIVYPYTYQCKSLVVGKIEKGFETIEKLYRHCVPGIKVYDCGLVIEQKNGLICKPLEMPSMEN